MKLDHANISNINIQFSSLANCCKNCSNVSAINVNFDLYENWWFYRFQFSGQILSNASLFFVLFHRFIFRNWHNDNRAIPNKIVTPTALSNRQSHTFLINFNSCGAWTELFPSIDVKWWCKKNKSALWTFSMSWFLYYSLDALCRALFLSL